MMNAPKDFSALLREWPQIQEDIAFLRAFRRLRVVNSFGYDIPLRSNPTSDNVVLDLRNLTPGGAAPAPAGPSTPSAPAINYFTVMERQFLQSISNNVLTPVIFDAEISNVYGAWKAGDPTKLVIPVAGVYIFTGYVNYTANATGTRHTRLTANGNMTFGTDLRAAVSAVDYAGANISGLWTFEAGDYVQMLTLQNSGAALTIHDARVAMCRLGTEATVSTSGLQPETQAWVAALQLAGGTIASDSIAIADAFIVAIKFTSIFPKIKYLLPMLGTGIFSPLVPLIDPTLKGNAVNTNFLTSDFSQSTGLQGNGTTKILTLPWLPSQLGSSNNGGIGYWENNINLAGNVEPMGVYGNSGNSRFVLDLRTAVRSFRWGLPANSAGDTTLPTNGHYYGQRSSATLRELFKNGVSLATNTTSDSAPGAADFQIRLVGANENGTIAQWPGRCALAYLTDGTMTATEITQFHALLQQYLITASGK